LALRFAPRWYFILLTAAAVPGFIALGIWQWHRGEHRREVWQQFERSDVEAIEANAASLVQLPLFTRVRVSGQFDSSRQILLDNISHDGQPGYEVLAVLRLADGSGLLVNRGWLPFTGFRDKLPDVAFEAPASAYVTGRLSSLPVPRMQRPDPGHGSPAFPSTLISKLRWAKSCCHRCCFWMPAPAPGIFAPGRRREFHRTAISVMHSSGGCSRCWRWVFLLD
jgi:SURF1 family